MQLGLSGPPVPSASLKLGKGSASGSDLRHVESVLSAGNAVSIATPDALTLRGAQVIGNRVDVNAGLLAIVSEQDRATYAERQRNLGLSVSPGTVAGNLNSSRQTGDFASVREQSGIYAGQGGYGITVAGNTNLVGGVMASNAAAAQNRLTTGTLTASDLANREQYKASSLTIGGGIGGVGKNANGEAKAPGTPGSALPGIRTGIGTVSATPAIALGASGKQSGTTYSAIAPGAIDITSGDTASRAVAATMSRDTTGANAGALVQQYDSNKREEIALGFAAATQLANQIGTFFANRAAEEEKAERDAVAAGVVKNADGTPLRDAQGRLVALNPTAQRYIDNASSLHETFGAGGPVRLVATALNGAAGSNVTGSLGALVQAGAANVLQGLAVAAMKDQVDLIADPRQRESTRAALQAVVGCAGAASGGSANCGGAAVGAAASVVLNNLLKNGSDASVGPDGRPLTIAQQEARRNLVGTIVAALGEALGGASPAAVLAAQIEGDNNSANGSNYVKGATTPFTPGQLASVNAYFRDRYLPLGGTDTERETRLQAVIDCSANAGCVVSDPVELAAFDAWADVAGNSVRVAASNRALNNRLVVQLAQSDSAVAEKLSGQSQAVITQVRLDIASDRGNNLVGRLSGNILSGVLSDDQIADLYVAKVSDRVGEREGSFDKALARGAASAKADGDLARRAADRQGGVMRDGGLPEPIIQAYLFKEYYNAAAQERAATALLGQVQFLGDYFSDPARIVASSGEGLIRTADAFLLNDKSAAERLAEADRALEKFAQSGVTDKATMLGNAKGELVAVAVDAAVTHGLGTATRQVANVTARVGNALESAAALRAARSIAADVATPYGPAVQSLGADAIAARAKIESGVTLYRIGKIGRSETANAQFWSLEYPLNPGYAGRYGLPPENMAGADFIESATLKPGTSFVTRPAPPVGTNPGGGIEVVVPESGVTMKYFGGR